MNRDKDAAFLYFPFVPLGFLLRITQTDQGSSESGDSGSAFQTLSAAMIGPQQ
jgi:hypothetical protein